MICTCVYIESQCVTTFHNLLSLASDVYKPVERSATECTGKHLVTQPLEVVLRLPKRLLGPLVRPDAFGTLRAVKVPTGHARDVGVVEESCRDADILAVRNIALLPSHGVESPGLRRTAFHLSTRAYKWHRYTHSAWRGCGFRCTASRGCSPACPRTVSSLCVVLLVVTGRGATGESKTEHWKIKLSEIYIPEKLQGTLYSSTGSEMQFV